LRLRSGEMRRVPAECRATIGEVGNSEHNLEKLGKAGAKRWRGIKPTVRGAAMNPVDHPHGGGEAKAGQGNPHPVTPCGVPTKGTLGRRAASGGRGTRRTAGAPALTRPNPPQGGGGPKPGRGTPRRAPPGGAQPKG